LYLTEKDYITKKPANRSISQNAASWSIRHFADQLHEL